MKNTTTATAKTSDVVGIFMQLKGSVWLILLLLWLGSPVQAVVRCTSPTTGQVTYSDTLCPVGHTSSEVAGTAEQPITSTGSKPAAGAPLANNEGVLNSDTTGAAANQLPPQAPIKGATGTTPTLAVQATFRIDFQNPSNSVRQAVDKSFFSSPRMKKLYDSDPVLKARLEESVAKSINGNSLQTQAEAYSDNKKTAWVPWSLEFDSTGFQAILAERKEILKQMKEIGEDADELLPKTPGNGPGNIPIRGVAYVVEEAPNLWRVNALAADKGSYPDGLGVCKGLTCNINQFRTLMQREWGKFLQQIGF